SAPNRYHLWDLRHTISPVYHTSSPLGPGRHALQEPCSSDAPQDVAAAGRQVARARDSIDARDPRDGSDGLESSSGSTGGPVSGIQARIKVDVPVKEIVVEAGVGRVGLDDAIDGDHRAGGLVEVGIDPGGDGRRHRRTQGAGLAFAGEVDGL